jgi:rhodanese-related sulfurtransferase
MKNSTHKFFSSTFSLLLFMIMLCGNVFGQPINSEIPKEKQTSLNLYFTAKEAYEKWKTDPEKVKILDVRTQEEYLYIGHPAMAWNIPLFFQSYEWDTIKNHFPMKPNPDFMKQIKSVFQMEDIILVTCRSGGRSAMAVNQLALYVVLYSPIQMLADLPENYEGNPAFKFLQDVPVDWEDTKVLNAEIGEYVTTVRKDRNSDDWYLGSITNEESRSFDIELSFLDSDAVYEAQIYADADGITWNQNASEVVISAKKVKSMDSLQVNLAEGGGVAIRFVKI